MEGEAGAHVRYVAVARLADRSPIAEYAAVDTRALPASLFADKLDKVLRSGRVGEHARLTITDHDVGAIHYDADPGCLYLVVAAREYPQRSAFKLLAEVRREFEATFADEVATARSGGLSRPARTLLKGLVDRYDEAAGGDRVAAVNLQVEEVQGVMAANIQSVLRNQDNLETLLDKSDAMRTEAATFQRSAGAVQKQLWWQNTRLMIIIGVLLVILLLVIILPIVL